jgi:predicted nucleic acid-binding protein
MVRGHKSRAIGWLRDVLDAGAVALARLEPADFESARRICERFADKDWSFTDCTSYVVMQRLGIVTEFAFDEHFRQFGICTVVP